MTETHTPLPWKVEEGHIQRDSNGIRYWQITDGQDAIACNQFCYAGYDPEVNAANAAFIVQAVNSHHRLVETAQALIDHIGPQNSRVYRSDPPVQNLLAALKEAGR